jgi:beta-N-acetylhexosaminidase
MNLRYGRFLAGLCVTGPCVLMSVGCGSPEDSRTESVHSSAGPTGSSSSPVSSAAAPRTAPSPAPTKRLDDCTTFAASLTLKEQIGQLIMMSVSSAGPSSHDVRTLAEHRVGSVVLLGNSSAGRKAIRRVVRRVRTSPGGVDTLVAVDQEGGSVQRLRGGGFDRIPSARAQLTLSDHALTKRARRWGGQLRSAGVDANLAPVADVVPVRAEATNQAIGALDRGYGPDPKVVAAKASAVIRGMDQAGIATSVKHFPGLGRVRGNTDFVEDVIDSSTTVDDQALRGFAAAIEEKVDMVMISSATYDRIDPRHQAALSRRVIEDLLRGRLGFRGVVVSDDLSTVAFSDVRESRRALRFFRAGGDVALIGDSAAAGKMIDAVVKEARSDRALRREIAVKATRVLRLKDRRGLADCG